MTGIDVPSTAMVQTRPVGGGLRETALTDARLSPQEDELPVPLEGADQGTVDHAELGLASDHRTHGVEYVRSVGESVPGCVLVLMYAHDARPRVGSDHYSATIRSATAMTIPTTRLTATTITHGRWALVPERGAAGFSVRDKLVATVHGTVPLTHGTVEVDDRGAVHAVSLVFDLSAIATGNARRDKDLRKPSLLDLDAHPVLRFSSRDAERTADGWRLRGVLSARGHDLPVTAHAQVLPESSDDTIVVRVRCWFDRGGLGMRVPAFIIGREIAVDVTAVFELTG